MTLETIYLVCFLVGFLLSLVSFLMQAGHGHAEPASLHAEHFPDGHLHVGHVAPSGHGGHGHAGHAGQGTANNAGPVVSRLNFSTVTAFLTWFGGSGYLLRKYTSVWTLVGLGAAAATGVIGAVIVLWFLTKLVERDRTLNPADFDMVGVLAHVSSTLRPAGTGEVLFVQDGARRSSPARSDDGTEIARGVEVVVTRYENGIAYVRRWDELTG